MDQGHGQPAAGSKLVTWYRWRVRTRLPERFGQRCTVRVRARTMNSCLVEFEDGYRVVTSRNYIRKAGDDDGGSGTAGSRGTT